MLGPLERYMTPTLDSALLISSWAGADLGRIGLVQVFCTSLNGNSYGIKYQLSMDMSSGLG